jgi:hypothetical protein
VSVLSLVPKRESSKAEALAIIDQLRAQIESGEAVCFAGVTINAADQVAAWSCTTQPVSRLRTMGAVSHLLACMHAGVD